MQQSHSSSQFSESINNAYPDLYLYPGPGPGPGPGPDPDPDPDPCLLNPKHLFDCLHTYLRLEA
jgi:hypothetical protein